MSDVGADPSAPAPRADAERARAARPNELSERPPLPPLPTFLASCTFVTHDLPGIGGRIKERPEDFLVEEQPLYQPSGQGEHIYVMVQKRLMPTMAAARVLATHFGVPLHAIGYAGLKDKHAITLQVFSIHAPGKKPEDFPMLRHESMQVLWADLHANKLRQGHLAGNRFSIKVRGVDMTKAIHAKRIMDRLERVGVPNRFGEQRFGYLGRNQEVGRGIILRDDRAVLDALLGPGPDDFHDHQRPAREAYARGEFVAALDGFNRHNRTERVVLGELSRGATPRRAVKMIGRQERSFYLSAFQSAIFNHVLQERVGNRGIAGLTTLEPGDIAFKHDSRATFDVDAAIASDPSTAERLTNFEISPSGPMWGVSMRRAGVGVGVGGDGSACDRLELLALESAGVSPADLARFEAQVPGSLEGVRRPLRVRVSDFEVEGGTDEHGPYVRAAFDLPRGAFATEVMREVMKPARMDEPESGDSNE